MKIFKWITFISFFSFLFFASTVSASSSTDMEGQLNKQLDHLKSPESYILYLKEEISGGNELASEGLERFLTLSEKEQQDFLKALQQPDKLLHAAETGEAVIDINGLEIPVKRIKEDETELSSNEINEPINITGSRTVTASESLYVGNLKVTTIYSTVTFNTSGTRATSIITSNHYHSDINPAMIWSKETSSNQTYMGNNNTRAYHRGDWTVYATGGLGFINDSVSFYVCGDAVYRSKQLSSTHPNWGYGWKTF